ncbi:MAG: hypothetical protein ACRC7R_05010 [Sarcina sp.]
MGKYYNKDINTMCCKKWAENNRELSNYLKNRSAARSFIRKKASLEDIIELRELMIERERELCYVETAEDKMLYD